MSKLPRVTQKIFGGSLSAPGNVAEFGSVKAGTPAYSTDPAAIQTSAWLLGIAAGLIGSTSGGNASPVWQELNGILYVVSRQLANLFERGIAEWDAGTTYDLGAIQQDGTGVPYYSKQANNLNHALTDTSWWGTLADLIASGDVTQLKLKIAPIQGPISDMPADVTIHAGDLAGTAQVNDHNASLWINYILSALRSAKIIGT